MKYSIIIPTYLNTEGLLECLKSIKKYTENDEIEIIIVSNGNKQKHLDLDPDFKTIFFEEPIGFSQAVNIGIFNSKNDYIIILNDDIVLLDQPKNLWINILETPFKNNKNLGITGVLKRHCSEISCNFLLFFCVMIPRKILEKVGYLDTRFTIGGCEDIDWCKRCQDLGYEILDVPESNPVQGFPIYHEAEKTMNKIENWNGIFENNLKKLKQKYDYEEKTAIIMPCYNSENTIINVLNHIKNQTYKNWDLYIINDKSTDSTRNKIESFILDNKDCRIKLINKKEQEGPSEARNEAIRIILKSNNYDYVAYCDSDDKWTNNHLESQIKFIKDNNIDFVYSNVYPINEKGEQLIPYGIPINKIFDGNKLLENNYIYISSVLHKVKCLNVGFFDKELDSIEDWDYWIRIFNNNFLMAYNDKDFIIYLCKENGMASLCNKEKLKRIKNKNMIELKKINLGCGDELLSGYINCDLYNPKADMNFDAAKCPFEDNSIDEISAYHLIEHFDFKQAFDVLKEWNRILKPGGKLVIETPDLYHTCKIFAESNEEYRQKLYSHFFAWPWINGQQHKFLYTETQLKWTLEQCGFENIIRVPPTSIYVQNNPPQLYLKIECKKKENL
ncbi:MAG: glycosyltransferase [Bacillota bacterium]